MFENFRGNREKQNILAKRGGWDGNRVVITFQKEDIYRIRWERRKMDLLLDCSYLFVHDTISWYDLIFRGITWLEQKITKPSLDEYSDLNNRSVLFLIYH